MTQAEELRFEVVLDQGYGRCWTRQYKTLEEAERGMAEWKRQGLPADCPGQLGGDWDLRELA